MLNGLKRMLKVEVILLTILSLIPFFFLDKKAERLNDLSKISVTQ